MWLSVTTLYGLKWFAAREVALTEAAHPVQCCFIGLGGVATMLVAGGIIPYSYGLALALYIAGAAFTAGFAIWRTGGLWMGERDPNHTTPALYLPAVAGSFVAAAVGAALGFPDAGQFFFGAGFFGWLAIESVLLHRPLTAPNMANALRPTLGIQLAPPLVGAVSLIAVAPAGPWHARLRHPAGADPAEAAALDPSRAYRTILLGLHLRRDSARQRTDPPAAARR